MHGAFAVKIHSPATGAVHFTAAIHRLLGEWDMNLFRGGYPACRELRDEHHAEPDIIVAIAGSVPVTVRATAVTRIVVPGTAAENTVRTLDPRPFIN